MWKYHRVEQVITEKACYLLCRLSQQLLRVNHMRPEPWTTVAMYCEIKGKRQEALAAIDKACTVIMGR